jgi:hypothetical protein
MKRPEGRRASRSAGIIDADAAGLVEGDGAVPSTGAPAAGAAGAGARSGAAAGAARGPAVADVVVAGASTTIATLVPAKTPPLWGSSAFFRRAAEELVTSTRTGRELAGACFVREQRGRVTLVGLKRELSGQPGRVGIDPGWGSILWHTHPGLKGSLAAFSLEDLEVARQARKPLLVVGFVGFSLDVLSTLALPFGWRAAVASAGVKGLLALEQSGRLPTRLLELGVGARVCWPSGLIRPVLRRGAAPWRQAVDEMSFAVDRGVGAVERTGQRALREVVSLFVDPRPK